MKVTISLVLSFFIILNSCYSQATTNSPDKLDRKYYLQKSKNQKIAAWILLGAGVIGIAAVTPANTNLNTTGTVVVIGGASILGSIPLFIAGSRNKRKAMNASASIKIDQRQYSLSSLSIKNYYPTLNLKLIL